MNDDQFKILTAKLDLLTRALFLNLVGNLEFKDKIVTLHKLGMKESEIITLLGEKRGRVNSVLRDLK